MTDLLPTWLAIIVLLLALLRLYRLIERQEDRISYLERLGKDKPYCCEHGIQDGDWCESCNKAYKAARKENDGS